jgi:hypothetical protein
MGLEEGALRSSAVFDLAPADSVILRMADLLP